MQSWDGHHSKAYSFSFLVIPNKGMIGEFWQSLELSFSKVRNRYWSEPYSSAVYSSTALEVKNMLWFLPEMAYYNESWYRFQYWLHWKNDVGCMLDASEFLLQISKL